MADFRVTVTVDDAVIKGLVTSEDVQSDMDRRSKNVLQMQQSLVAVDTGDLKRSLSIKPAPNGGRQIGSFGIAYAVAQELGWQAGRRFIPGQPYLRPSIDAAAR